MFQRERRDPDVILRDGGAGFGQLRSEAAIVFRSRHPRRQHNDCDEEVLNFGYVFTRILRQVRSAVEFAKGRLG